MSAPRAVENKLVLIKGTNGVLLWLQGIDLKAGGRNKRVHRTAPKSDNPYLKLLVKVRFRWQLWGCPQAGDGSRSSLYSSNSAWLGGAVAAFQQCQGKGGDCAAGIAAAHVVMGQPEGVEGGGELARTAAAAVSV